MLLIPTFSGGTATIGSTGVGSSDITTSAVSGSSYSTPPLTSPKTYTLTVTDSKGNVFSTTCVVTPTAIAISPISPANQTVRSGPDSFCSHCDWWRNQWPHLERDCRHLQRERVDFSNRCRHLHDHRNQRGRAVRFCFDDDLHQRARNHDATRQPACLHWQRTIAHSDRLVRFQLSVESERNSNSWCDEFKLHNSRSRFRECRKLFRHSNQWCWQRHFEYCHCRRGIIDHHKSCQCFSSPDTNGSILSLWPRHRPAFLSVVSNPVWWHHRRSAVRCDLERLRHATSGHFL